MNQLYWIYIFSSGVRWGSWLGRHCLLQAKFASIWIEWSSINSPLDWLLEEWLLLMLSIPISFEKKVKYRRAKLNWLVSYLFNGFPENLKQSYNVCIRLQCIQWSNRECRPSVWSAAAESFSEICKVKERLNAVLQITSAQQHAPIHFILPHLKLNRTWGSTHWRRKYKTRPIRSTKRNRLTTRVRRCGHNKQWEAKRSTFARLCSSAAVS